MKLRILYIVNGMGFSKLSGIGGSDKRVAEIGKRLIKNTEVSTLTTNSGYQILKKEGLLSNFILIPTPPSFLMRIESLSFGRVFSYGYEILNSAKIRPPKNTIIYSSSDFLCDTVPSFMLKRQGNETKLVFMIHHLINVPWRREGSFLINLLNYISQQLSFSILKNKADLVLVYDTLEGQRIKDHLVAIGYNGGGIRKVKNGIDLNFISNVPKQHKFFDACFVGGLRASKGIHDLILIWDLVCKVKTDAKLLVIGGGPERTVSELKKEISARHLEDNVIMTGPLSGRDLFFKVNQCKVFVLPSHEEGWGIAVCEAMCCGLPVVVYNLPGYSPFTDFIIKVPIGNIDQYVTEILKLLEDPNNMNKIGEESRKFVKRYDWDLIADEELKILEELSHYSLHKDN